jgi:hypothetical protein
LRRFPAGGGPGKKSFPFNEPGGLRRFRPQSRRRRSNFRNSRKRHGICREAADARQAQAITLQAGAMEKASAACAGIPFFLDIGGL